ncbi:auxilin-like protein 1 [Prunus yedoensis var. nudiflora]|uniref:Auxilin-like protein 1 n=1 Tax=Prunus yedoensis var. nudiflora TaxID=2094558 RepID=A0A314UFI5_PRUYE|nr:auxilin-like protein 1 [Prunus yedoensis var. nudiflora]
MGFGENQDYQFAREPEIVLNLGKHVEESGDLDRDMMEAEVSANHEKNRINSKSSHRKRWSDIIDVSETLIKLKENGNLSESVEEENAVEEKEICETDGLALGVKLAEILKEMEDSIETHPSDENDININTNAMNYWQKQNDQLAGEPVVLCNLEEHVEESEEINKDTMEAEVAVNQEESKNNSRSSQRKRWFGDGKNTEVAQLSHMFRRKGGNVLLDHEMRASLCTKENKEKHEKLGTNQRLEENEENQQATLTKESETIDTSLKEVEQEKSENCQTTFTAEESETERSSQKDAREGKNENQVTLTTQEKARERALEKALSGKAACEAGKQTKRSLSEKISGASRDDGLKPGVSPFDPESKGSFPSSMSRNPNSSNHSDPYSAERSGGTNGESAQRSKARLERNQRTAERAAKALAEKNMRDLLVQKEQAERNRFAEALDAEVKRWSSGKERNLRALLSTLQYILGPDSGWQPIPLTDVVTAVAVKKAYRKAALFVHPDKLQQRGASIQQKYTCEKVFDLLKEAWNRFNVEER